MGDSRDGEIKSLDQQNKITSALVQVDKNYPTLRTLLDNQPGVIVKTDPYALADPYKLEAMSLKEWSPVATVIACAYRLMTSFPSRVRVRVYDAI